MHVTSIAIRNSTQFNCPHPDDDAHSLALRGEGEDLQDAEGEDLSRRSLELQGVQVSVDQGEAHALSPSHQLHLQTGQKNKQTSVFLYFQLFFFY